jgi:hypothetical protein
LGGGGGHSGGAFLVNCPIYGGMLRLYWGLALRNIRSGFYCRAFLGLVWLGLQIVGNL